jgi:hypothetical protein
LGDIASHQRHAAEIGEPWHRLVIDFDRSGRLSVRAIPEADPRLRRVTRLLLLAALIVLAMGAVHVLIVLA